MRKYTYCEYDPDSDQQDKLITVTEEEILERYYPYWKLRMRKAGHQDKISEQNCIDDWCVLHWAWEVDG